MSKRDFPVSIEEVIHEAISDAVQLYIPDSERKDGDFARAATALEPTLERLVFEAGRRGALEALKDLAAAECGSCKHGQQPFWSDAMPGPLRWWHDLPGGSFPCTAQHARTALAAL